MAEFFQRNKSTISRHIKNVLEDGELDAEEVVAFFATTTQHGAMEGKTQEHQVVMRRSINEISDKYPYKKRGRCYIPVRRYLAETYCNEM